MIKNAIKQLAPRNGWVLLEDLYKSVAQHFPKQSVLIELETLRQIGKIELNLEKQKVKII